MSKAAKIQMESEIYCACVVAGLDYREIKLSFGFGEFWHGYHDWIVVTAKVGEDYFRERFRFKDLGRRSIPLGKLLIKLINRALQHSIYGEA